MIFNLRSLLGLGARAGNAVSGRRLLELRRTRAGSVDEATEDLAAFTRSGRRIFGLDTTNGGRIVIFGGGLPIVRDGRIIGGIGVSGSTADQDVLVARAGLTAVAAP